MAGFSIQTRIAAPIEAVFALASDFAGAAGHIKGIKKVEMLTPGPVGVGTRFRETREMFGKDATEEMEVTAFDPPRSYTLGCHSCGAKYATTFRFEAEGDATQLVCDFEATPATWWAWLFKPLAGLMMGAVKKCVQQDI